MAHPRTLVRQGWVTSLTGATSAGSRVFDSRVDPFRKGDLPALSVCTLSEPVDPDSGETSPRELTRRPNVEVILFVRGQDEPTVARALDDLALEVEILVDAEIADDARCFGRSVSDARLDDTNIEILADNGHSDPFVGVAVLTYIATYRTQQGALATDEFVTVDSTHKLVGGVSDTVPAEDKFTVRTP
jgi:hypothetical protein